MSHSSWYALEAVGTERATSDLGNFLVVGNAQVWAIIFPSFLFVHSHFFPFNHFPFFWRLTNVAGQIFFGSYPAIQIITWHFGNSHCTAAAFLKHWRNNSKRPWPWERTWPHSCLWPHLLLCLSDLFPSVRIKWNHNGEKDLSVWRKRKLILKVTKVNKGFYLVRDPYRKQITLCLYEMSQSNLLNSSSRLDKNRWQHQLDVAKHGQTVQLRLSKWCVQKKGQIVFFS